MGTSHRHLVWANLIMYSLQKNEWGFEGFQGPILWKHNHSVSAFETFVDLMVKGFFSDTSLPKFSKISPSFYSASLCNYLSKFITKYLIIVARTFLIAQIRCNIVQVSVLSKKSISSYSRWSKTCYKKDFTVLLKS